MYPLLAIAGAVGGGLLLYAFVARERIVVGFDQGKPYLLKVVKLSTPLQNGSAAYLRSDAANAFEMMLLAARAQGVNIQVSSAFRSIEEQLILYMKNRLRDCWETTCRTSPPGYSNHQQGTTVDLDTNGGTNSTYAWMQRRGYEFGFQRTVPTETHHYEYVGIAARQGATG